MKFLFDQNISHRILGILPKEFEGSSTVKKEKLINASDKSIWDFAKRNQYTIVIQDWNFNDLSDFFSCPLKIIWLRTGNLTMMGIKDMVNNNIS
jgi:predicted nuclease of predicted toxin-antitoxin system